MRWFLFCVCWIKLSGQTVQKTMALLPDTGQTNNYTSTFGEDSDYSINPPQYVLNNDGTLTDVNTGLMWAIQDGGEMTFESAQIYCDQLNLAGYTDWRLPSPIEGFSILNHQRNNPAIDTNYFATTSAEYWWTSKTQLGDANKVWCTNAGGGIGNHPKSETISAGGSKKFHVRAVRLTSPTIELTERFMDNADGTITDLLTQLTWQKAPNTASMTWEQALSYAEQLSLSGNSQWRLPNIKELQSLHDPELVNPAIGNVFNNVGVRNYWSSTTLSNQNFKAWYWNTQFGITTYDLKTNSNYVICVSGESSLNNQNQDFKSYTIYPNPADAYFQIYRNKSTEAHLFSLYNSLGQKVAEFSSYQMNTSLVPNGIYFLKVDDGTLITQKIMISH